MRNKYDFTGYLAPIVSDYNKEMLEAVEIIEQRIKFVQSDALATAYASQDRTIEYDNETGRISRITYSKKEDYNFAGSFSITPKWNGKFDLRYRNHVEEILNLENLSMTSFLACISDESIDTLKAFWEAPHLRK